MTLLRNIKTYVISDFCCDGVDLCLYKDDDSKAVFLFFSTTFLTCYLSLRSSFFLAVLVFRSACFQV